MALWLSLLWEMLHVPNFYKEKLTNQCGALYELHVSLMVKYFEPIDKNALPCWTQLRPPASSRHPQKPAHPDPHLPTNPRWCAWIFGRKPTHTGVGLRDPASKRIHRATEKRERNQRPAEFHVAVTSRPTNLRRCAWMFSRKPTGLGLRDPAGSLQKNPLFNGKRVRKKPETGRIPCRRLCLRVANHRGDGVVAGWSAEVMSEVFRHCWVSVDRRDRHFLGYSFYWI
jgi:hypothetical protein